MGKTTILMAEDHKLMRVGLKSIFEDYDDLDVIAEAQTGVEAVKLAKRSDGASFPGRTSASVWAPR